MDTVVKEVCLSIRLTEGQHVSRSGFSRPILRPVSGNIDDWYHLRQRATRPLQGNLQVRYRICRGSAGCERESVGVEK